MSEDEDVARTVAMLRDQMVEMEVDVHQRGEQTRRQVSLSLAMDFFGDKETDLYTVLRTAKTFDDYIMSGALPREVVDNV